jgi:hypothetical protein
MRDRNSTALYLDGNSTGALLAQTRYSKLPTREHHEKPDLRRI